MSRGGPSGYNPHLSGPRSGEGQQTYGVVPDGRSPELLQDGLVMIRLRVDERQPPTGEVTTDDNVGTLFRGWLDLLRVLAEALSPDRPSGDGPPPP